MAAFTYTAARSLVAGHVLGTDYSLDVKAQMITRSPRVQQKLTQSLGGGVETIVQRRDENWSVILNDIHISELPALREFLDSVDAGQSFLFDAYGSVAVPDNPISVIAQPGYAEVRQGFSDYFVISLGLLSV